MRVIFLLLPHVHLLDLAGPAQVFYEANQLGGRQRFSILYAGAPGTTLSEQGLDLGPLRSLRDLHPEPRDLICVPGVDFARFCRGELREPLAAVGDWLREHHRRGARVASICSGALLLAELGLLDHRPCTTHWKCLDYLRTHYPYARVLDNRLYTGYQGVFTSAGMTAGIDMALAMVEEWVNPLLAAHVAREMVVSFRRQEVTSQEHIFLDFKNHLNPHVYQAQQLIENRLADNPSAEAIAAELHLSPRHLNRLFKEQNGLTLHEYKTRRRLERARQLLDHSQRTVKEVAAMTGFADASQLIKVWKKRWGETPGRRGNDELY